MHPRPVRGSHSESEEATQTLSKSGLLITVLARWAGPMSQVLERQQHWLACSQYLPTDACTRWGHGGRPNADCQLDYAASGCPPGVFLSLLRHMAFMDTLAALGWSIGATGACAASHVKAPARLVAQHQNPAQRRTVLALLRYTHLPYSVASDSKLLETSRGLGTLSADRQTSYPKANTD